MHIRRVVPVFFILLASIAAAATGLPIKEWKTTTQDKPLLFYVSGDGGLNTFSMGLCATLHELGYDVIALNARSYFWNKKLPKQAAADWQPLVHEKRKDRKNQHVIYIGYSFGADVLPFVFNQFSPTTKSFIKKMFLLSATTSTDMEIHLADMLSEPKKRTMDVVAEINKIASPTIHFIMGDKDLFPFAQLQHNAAKSTLPGGHNFKDYKAVASIIHKSS